MEKRRHTGIVILLGLLSGIGLTGCDGKEGQTPARENILVEAGDSALSVDDVLLHIPSGLAEEDSIEMFKTIVDRWVRNMMLGAIAAENVPDMERIDRLVEDYRNNLIIERYMRTKEEEAPAVSDADIMRYYEVNGDEMLLDQPLVKGIYLKIGEKEERLAEIRKWMKTATEASVDNIEKYGLRQASQYEYFGQRWLEWSVIAEQIPYRFFDADAFLSSTRDFETTYGGSVYLLHISEYLPTGSKMPFEYASVKIAGILANENRDRYRTALMNSIYTRAIREGRLKPGLYNPVSHEIKKIK